VVELVSARLAVGKRMYRSSYALRLIHSKSGAVHWLMDDQSVLECRRKCDATHPLDEWK